MDIGSFMNEGGVYSLAEFTDICNNEGLYDNIEIQLSYNMYISYIYGTEEDVHRELLKYNYYIQMKTSGRLN